jgi:hypothetical protein
MQHNAEVGLFTRPSNLVFSYFPGKCIVALAAADFSATHIFPKNATKYSSTRDPAKTFDPVILLSEAAPAFDFDLDYFRQSY